MAKKVTLRDVLPLMPEIERLDIDVRSGGRLEHQYIIGDMSTRRISEHQLRMVEDGDLTIVDKRINVHGEEKRTGTEMGYSVKMGEIEPAEILDMELTVIRESLSDYFGNELKAHVERGETQIQMEETK